MVSNRFQFACFSSIFFHFDCHKSQNSYNFPNFHFRTFSPFFFELRKLPLIIVQLMEETFSFFVIEIQLSFSIQYPVHLRGFLAKKKILGKNDENEFSYWIKFFALVPRRSSEKRSELRRGSRVVEELVSFCRRCRCSSHFFIFLNSSSTWLHHLQATFALTSSRNSFRHNRMNSIWWEFSISSKKNWTIL